MPYINVPEENLILKAKDPDFKFHTFSDGTKVKF